MIDEIPIAKPVVKEPTVSSTPPSGRMFPCPACGARLEFNPAERGLNCPYCGHIQKIERGDQTEIIEREFGEYLSREEGKGQAIPGRSSEVRCTGCGANVLLEDKVQTDQCPFCATHLENKPEVAHAMIAAESLLPFRIDLRGARECFTRWLGNLWFAPSELRKIATLGQLNGIYIPYWTYDAMTVTFYDGERGDDYQVTEYYTDTDANGNSVRRSRIVTYTRWNNVSGEVRHFFDDILICGNKSLPAELINDLGDWPLAKLEPFRPEYLSGFRTERYAVGLKEGLDRAKKIMQPIIIQLIRRDIGGDHQRIHNQQSRYSAVTFKPLLLPIWLAVYRYRDRTFQILVNGRSGKVTGYRPYSIWKIAGVAALGIFALIALIILIMLITKK